MATDISMCSNALVLIGEDPISALDENTAAANLYASVYQTLLSYHPWTFAKKEVALSQNTAKPDTRTRYSYSYNLPSDMLRLWEVIPHIDYQIIGNALYTNATDVYVRYVYKVEETNLPAHFVTTMQYKLAAEFAISVTEDDNRAALWERKHRDQLMSSLAIDSQSEPVVQQTHQPFANPYYTGRWL